MNQRPYVYIIQNLERTYWYVGYKQKPKAGEDYCGSSKYLKDLIKKTGKENWTKTIIKEFDAWQEAYEFEQLMLEFMWEWPGRVNKARNGFVDHNDPEVKEKQKAGCRKKAQDPVWQANVTAANQKKAQDPVWQANQKAGALKRAKPFIATKIDTGEEFYCESGYCDQVKALGLTQGGISAFLRGTYPTSNYKGFTFRYV